MSRPIRIEYKNAFYHVTSRGNARNNIFRDEFDKNIFFEVIGEAYTRFGFILHAFVLMDNHYHFLIETPQANLSSVMQHINGVYTQAFNRRYKQVGHVLQGRYKSLVVDRDAYYFELVRYIHLNPWRARIVKELDNFKHSSHRAIVDKSWAMTTGKWYDRNRILCEFGKSENEGVIRYREFIEAGKNKDNPLSHAIGGYALGDRNFADWLWKEFIDGESSQKVNAARNLRPKIDAGKIISIVCKKFQIGHKEIFKGRRGKIGFNQGRGMALYILNKHTSMTQKEIGELAGEMNSAAVSEAVRLFAKKMAGDSILQKSYEQVLQIIR
mgnify:CR=1 FL=1